MNWKSVQMKLHVIQFYIEAIPGRNEFILFLEIPSMVKEGANNFQSAFPYFLLAQWFNNNQSVTQNGLTFSSACIAKVSTTPTCDSSVHSFILRIILLYGVFVLLMGVAK